jgi:hypothetical protein
VRLACHPKRVLAALTNQDDAIQVFPGDLIDDVVDVRRQVDRVAGEVRVFTDAPESVGATT